MRTLSMLLLVAVLAIGAVGCSSDPVDPVATSGETPEESAAIAEFANYNWQNDATVLKAGATSDDPTLAGAVAARLADLGAAAAGSGGAGSSGKTAANLSEMTDEEKDQWVAAAIEKLKNLSADDLEKEKNDLLADSFPEEFEKGIGSEEMRLQLRSMLAIPELKKAFEQAVEASEDLKTAVEKAKEAYPKFKEALGE